MSVCPDHDSDEAEAWIGAGDVPELATASQVSFLDIDSGHWPMVSRSARFARTIDHPVESAQGTSNAGTPSSLPS